MKKYLAYLFFAASCSGNDSSEHHNASNLTDTISGLKVRSEVVLQEQVSIQDFINADSVVLLSHHSPNMPIKNPKSGGYYKDGVDFIRNEQINYATSVQERKQLNKKEIEELIQILVLPAVEDSIKSNCFQPRNAVAVFTGRHMVCFDFCFDCDQFTLYGNVASDLIMNRDKYQKLKRFYERHGFTYQLP